MPKDSIPGSITEEIEDALTDQYVVGSLTTSGKIRLETETLATQIFSEMNMLILLLHIDRWIAMVNEEIAELEKIRLEESERMDLLLIERYNMEAQLLEERRLELLNELLVIEKLLEEMLSELNKEYLLLDKLIDGAINQIKIHDDNILGYIDRLNNLYSENYNDLLNKKLGSLLLDLSSLNIPSGIFKNDTGTAIEIELNQLIKELQKLTIGRYFDSDKDILDAIKREMDLAILGKFINPHSEDAMKQLEIIKLSKQYLDTAKHIFDVGRSNFTESVRSEVSKIESSLTKNVTNVKELSKTIEQYITDKKVAITNIENIKGQLEVSQELKGQLAKQTMVMFGSTIDMYKKLNIAETFTKDHSAMTKQQKDTASNIANTKKSDVKTDKHMLSKTEFENIFGDDSPTPSNKTNPRRR